MNGRIPVTRLGINLLPLYKTIITTKETKCNVNTLTNRVRHRYREESDGGQRGGCLGAWGESEGDPRTQGSDETVTGTELSLIHISEPTRQAS